MLDHRARGQARATAEQLLALRATDVAVLQPDGTHPSAAPQEQVAPGDRVLVGMGERIGVDGVVERGSVDARRQPGHRREPAGRSAGPGAAVFAGTLNLGAAADGARDGDRRRARCWPSACG